MGGQKKPGISGYISLLIIAVVIYKAHQSSVAEEQQADDYAKSQKLTANETAAFKACRDSLSGKKLKAPAIEGRQSLYSEVPWGVCACHARTIAKLYLPQYYGDMLTVTYHIVEKQPLKLNPEHLQPQARNGSAFDQLRASLALCSISQIAEDDRANADRARQLLKDRPQDAEQLKRGATFLR